MMGSSPPSAGGTSDAVFALLTALGDPEKAKAKLTELADAQASLERAKEAHDKALWKLNEEQAGFSLSSSQREAELSRRHAEVTASAAKLTADVAEHQEARSKAMTDLAARAQKLQAAEAALASRTSSSDQALQAREQAVTARESAVAAHEKELDDRHSVLDSLHDEAMKLKTDAEARFEALRSIIDPSSSFTLKVK